MPCQRHQVVPAGQREEVRAPEHADRNPQAAAESLWAPDGEDLGVAQVVHRQDVCTPTLQDRARSAREEEHRTH